MFDIGIGHYLTLGAVIFTIGVVGIFLNRKNVIVILMSIELILLAVNINLISFSIFSNDIVGQIFTILRIVEYFQSLILFYFFIVNIGRCFGTSQNTHIQNVW